MRTPERLLAFAAKLAILLVASWATCGAALAAGAWDDIKARGTIRVGVIPNRPCYYWQEDGSEAWKGFPVQMSRDLVAALSKEMGSELKIEWVPTSWTTVILDTQSSKIDFFIGLAFTEERKRAVDMFGPMWAVPDVAIGRKGFQLDKEWASYNKPDVRVSVAMGTTNEQALDKNAPKATKRSFKSSSDATLDVQSGHADVLIETVVSALAAMKVNNNLTNMVILEPYNSTPSGGAMRKDGDGRLFKFTNEWANQYYKDGNSEKAIYAALDECKLDTHLLPADTKF